MVSPISDDVRETMNRTTRAAVPFAAAAGTEARAVRPGR
jgi:hypothetical protein